MPLVKCIDCGKEISNEAVSCLYCGKPNDSIIEGNKLRNSFLRGTIGAYKIFISIFLSIIALVFLVLHFYFGVVVIGLILFFTFRWLNKAKKVFKK